RSRELGRGDPTVAAEQDGRELGPCGEGRSDATNDVRVEVVGNDPAHVVRLEDAVKIGIGHGAASYRSRRTGRADAFSASLLDHEIDHRRQRDELPLLEPPLRLAEVAGGEPQVAVAHGHRDRDEIALSAGGAGAVAVGHTRSFGAAGRGGHSTLPSSLVWAGRRPDGPRRLATRARPGDGTSTNCPRPNGPRTCAEGRPSVQTATGVVRRSWTTQPTGGVMRAMCSGQRSRRFGSRSSKRSSTTTIRSV